MKTLILLLLSFNCIAQGTYHIMDKDKKPKGKVVKDMQITPFTFHPDSCKLLTVDETGIVRYLYDCPVRLTYDGTYAGEIDPPTGKLKTNALKGDWKTVTGKPDSVKGIYFGDGVTSDPSFRNISIPVSGKVTPSDYPKKQFSSTQELEFMLVELWDKYKIECYKDSTLISYRVDCNGTIVYGNGMYGTTAMACPMAKKWVHKDPNDLLSFMEYLRNKK
jgi:hypothetical protein